MSFAINGAELQSATIRLPRRRIWSARVAPLGSKVLTLHQAVTLTIGSLTLAGTVRAGGTFVDSSEYLIVGGADGWARPVKKKSYRSDSGIKLSTVVPELAKDAGERVHLEAGAERSLGYAWTRPAGLASEALEALGVPWWMHVDGVTHLGDRPETDLSTKIPFAVAHVDTVRRRARLGVPDDALGAFAPGVRLDLGGGAGLFRIGSVLIEVATERVSLEVQEA